MVEAYIDQRYHTGRIILRPNASLSWQSNLKLLYVLFILSAIISLGFMSLGAWVILPYSMLEMAALSACIYYCVRQCRRLEVITVSEFEVTVERGIKSPTERFNYNRSWAKSFVISAESPWGLKRIGIRSHGRDLEFGNFLNREDKQILIGFLHQLVPV